MSNANASTAAVAITGLRKSYGNNEVLNRQIKLGHWKYRIYIHKLSDFHTRSTFNHIDSPADNSI